MRNRPATALIATRGLLALGLVLSLGACEGVKSQLGLGKQRPDEFKVVARAPLSLPPDFTLRPPEPGTVRPQEGTATQQARTAVFRAEDQEGNQAMDAAIPQDGRSQGERALLFKAGATNSDSSIRNTIDNETAQFNESNQDFIDTLVFWRDKQQPGVIVDAEAEAARLRENAALGRGATSGQTPTIERKKEAILEGLF
jgi:hypothetical protein